MRFTKNTMDRLKEEMGAEVDRLIEEYPIKLKIDGKDVHLDDIQIDGGEIEINIRTPFEFPDTDEIAMLDFRPREEE